MLILKAIKLLQPSAFTCFKRLISLVVTGYKYKP